MKNMTEMLRNRRALTTIDPTIQGEIARKNMAAQAKECVINMGETYRLHPANYVKRLDVPRESFVLSDFFKPNEVEHWSVNSVFKVNPDRNIARMMKND